MKLIKILLISQNLLLRVTSNFITCVGFLKPVKPATHVTFDEISSSLSSMLNLVFNPRRNEDSGYEGIFELNDLISQKFHEEQILEKRRKTLVERLSEMLGLHEKDNLREIEYMTDKELLDLVRGLNLDDYRYVIVANDLQEIRTSTRLIKSLERKIKFLLYKIKRYTFNFKLFFKRMHSFHFKNLDDYHLFTLIDRGKLIKV